MKYFNLLYYFLIFLFVSCSRYEKTTITKITIRGVTAITSEGSNITLTGVSESGEYFQKTFRETNATSIELSSESWTFFGIRLSGEDQLLCGLTTETLVARQQTVSIEYNKSNCQNSIFGGDSRYSSELGHLKPLKMFLCNELPIDGAIGCGSQTAFDGKSAIYTINEVSLSTTNSPDIKTSGGISSSCVEINENGGLSIPSEYLQLPTGSNSNFPNHSTITFFELENCQGSSVSLSLPNYLLHEETTLIKKEVLSDSYKMVYAIDSFGELEEEESQLLSAGENCVQNTDCESEICAQVPKTGLSLLDPATEYNTNNFDLQCYKKNATSSCNSDNECESGICKENNGGQKVCLKVSLINDSYYCYQNSDCLSGYCHPFNSEDPNGGYCKNVSLLGKYLTLDSSDTATLDLGTNPSIDGFSSFSVSLWFKTNDTSPQVLVSQRDQFTHLGSYSIGINGAAPSFSGFRPNENYNQGSAGEINFSFYLDGTNNHHIIGTPEDTFVDDRWHHLLVSREVNGLDSTYSIFLDSVELTSQTFTGEAFSLNSAIHTYVGGNYRDSREYFNGGLDLVTIWGKVFTIQEISELYSLGQNHNIILDPEINQTDITGNLGFDHLTPIFASLDQPNDAPVVQTVNFTNILATAPSVTIYESDFDESILFCLFDADCIGHGAGYLCDNTNNRCALRTTSACTESDQCFSRNCSENTCRLAALGMSCIMDTDCESNSCDFNVCTDNPVNSFSFDTFDNTGLSKTSITINLNDSTGQSLKIFNDSDCTSLLTEKNIDSNSELKITLHDLAEGANSFFAIYTDGNGQESECIDLEETYTVLSTINITNEARQDPLFNITSTQHSEWYGSIYPANLSIDGDLTTFSHTLEVNDGTPHWILHEFNERIISKITVYSRSEYARRFRDLDLVIYNSTNDPVYTYSSIAGEYFKKGVDDTTETWELDLTTLNHTSGGVGTPIRGSKIKLIRYPATENIVHDNVTDKNTLNIAEIIIEGIESDGTNYALPPYLVKLHPAQTLVDGYYNMTVKGNFNNSLITLYSDEYCSNDKILGIEANVTGESIEVSLPSLDLSNQEEGEINIYTKIINGSGSTSLCSSAYDINGTINYGLTNIGACTEDLDCVPGHPDSLCSQSKCVLRPGYQTTDASWCSEGTATAGFCDFQTTPINSLSLHRGINAGGDSAVIEINAADATGYDLEVFVDANCHTSVGSFSIPGSESSYIETITGIPEGDQYLYYKFTKHRISSPCIPTFSSYTSLSETNLKTEYQNGDLTITPSLSTQHGSHLASHALDNIPPGDAAENEASVAHTGTDKALDLAAGGPYWQMEFENEIPLTYLKFWSRTAGNSVSHRFRDLNVLIYNDAGDEIYNYQTITGSLFRQGGGVSSASFEIDLSHLNVASGELGAPIMAKKVKLTRTEDDVGTLDPEDDYVLTIQDVDVKGWLLGNNHNYLSPAYKIDLNVEQSALTNNPVFDISGNFHNSTIILFSDDTCSGDELGSESSVSGNTVTVEADEFSRNDSPEGNVSFYAAVKNSNDEYSACSSLNDISGTYVNSHLAEEGDACTADSDCGSGFCRTSTNLCANIDDQLLAIGDDFTCFAINGSPQCFGKNNHGQLGNGNTTDSYTPGDVKDTSGNSLTNIIQLSAGEQHACALNNSGEVYCWGKGAANLYADSNSADKNQGAVKIQGITATKISTATNYTCAVSEDSDLVCWGNNAYSSFGGGGPYTTPTILIDDNIVDIKASEFFSCFRYNDDTIRCMGDNSKAQTGRDPNFDATTTLNEISSLTNMSDQTIFAESFDIGNKTGCFTDDQGDAHCWGGNGKGQLGANINPNRSYRSRQSQLSGATVEQVSVGLLFSCFLLEDHTVKCAGKNASGQLGRGMTSLTEDPPDSVQNLTDITLIEAGFGHSCAFDIDNKLLCWGDNASAQISDTNLNIWSSPVEVYNPQ